MGIPPSPCLGGFPLCRWRLEPLPWRPSALLRLLGGIGVGVDAGLLDRLPPAVQCPELAWQHLPVAGSINPRPAWGDASALRLRFRSLVFRVLQTAAKIHARWPPVLGRWPSRPDAARVKQAARSMLAAHEFRADTRAREGEERDEQQQRHPGD